MARQVLPWVGAAVGAYFGNAQLGFAIGSMIGNAVDPQVIKGPALGEGQNNTASEGGYRPIVLGKGAVGVCMIHQGPEIIRTIRHRQSKGGGPVTEEQRRYRTMAFALGESAYPETGVVLLRLWIDNKLAYDVTPTSQIVEESAEFASRFTFYPGNDTQEPDPDLEAMPEEWGGGVGNVPSYRGGCPYIVFPEWDVTDSRGMAPMIRAEVASAGKPPQFEEIFVADLPNGAVTMDWSPDNALIAVGHYTESGNSLAIFRRSENGFEELPPVAPQPAGRPHGLRWSPDGNYLGVAGEQGNGVRLYRRVGNTFIAGNTTGHPDWQERGLVFHQGYVIVPFSGDPIWGAPPVLAVWQQFGADLVLVSDDTELAAAPSGVDSIDSNGSVLTVGLQDHPYIEHFSFAGGSMSSLGTLGISVSEPVKSPRYSPDGRYLYAVSGGALRAWERIGSAFVSRDVEAPTAGNLSGVAASNGGLVAVGGNAPSVTVYEKSGDDYEILTELTGAMTQAQPVAWSRSGGYLAAGSSDLTIYAVSGGAEKSALSGVVGFIHDRVGDSPESYDVSELLDMVEGVVFADGYTGASAMQSLMGLYFFGAGEYDAGTGYRLHYVKRGKPAVITLTEDDIVEGPEDWEREDSYERPRVLHVQYPNPVADYGAPNIVIKRTSPDVLVVGERSVSIPVVFSDVDEITRRADVMMTVVYTEIAGTYKLVLPWSLLTLAPTDTIGFSIRGRTRRLRLDQWRFSPDGTISTEFMADRQSAWTSNVTGLPAIPSKPPPPSIVGPTISAVLDIPALADNLDSLHLIVAATGVSPAWYGADHQRKLPSDADYTTMLRFSGVTTIMGVLQSDVTDASEHFTDTTNIVRVKLYRDDELLTYTQEQFLSENGAFALAWDDSGTRRWEVCQYRDAVKVGEAEWELTTLQRGRLNTETAEHPTGSLFVLLDAGVRAMPMQSPMLGQDITHRAVSIGQLPDQAVPYTESYTGESQREWPVTDLIAGLNGDDLEVAWIPRHRFGTDDAPIASQNWRGYRVSATDGVNTSTAETTVEGHTFDVTGWSTPITVSVSQINRITGEGPSVTKEVA